MRKLIFLSIILLFNFSQLSSQELTLSWISTFNGSAQEKIIAMNIDNSGNIYLSGYFSGDIDFDPGPDSLIYNSTNGQRELFILKMDASENVLWVKTLIGNSAEYGFSIEFDETGNVYLAGAYFETVDFDPGPDEYNLTAVGLRDAFLLKLDTDGNFIWVKTIGAAASESVIDFIIDENGNITLLVFYQVSADFDPGVGEFILTTENVNNAGLLKLDANGNFLWAKNSFQGGSVSFVGLKEDSKGNLYAGGRVSGSNPVDFDAGAGETLVTPDGTDICLLKLDSLGDFIWVRSMGDDHSDECTDFVVDSNDDIIMTGTYRNTTDFDPGPDTYILPAINSSYESFVCKFNESGEFIWAAPIYGVNSEFSESIKLDDQNNIYTTGGFAATTDFDPGVGAVILSAEILDIYILKLSPAGEYIWVEAYGGPGNENASLLSYYNNAIYITGAYLEPFSVGDDDTSLVATDNYDPFLMRFSQCNAEDITPVPEVENLSNLFFTCDVYQLDPPKAINSCGDPIFGTSSISFPISNPDTVVVTWTYTNSFGTSVSQDQVVVVNDTVAPAPNNIDLEEIIGECSIEDLPNPGVTDNCSAVVISNDVSLPLNTAGSTTVTWTYTDENGNSSTQIQLVTVIDTIAPVASQENLDELFSDCSIEMPVPPTAVDNCTGETIVGVSDVTFPIEMEGVTVVTWTYDDGNGNVLTQTQNATISPIDNSVTLNENTLSAVAGGYEYQWFDCNNGNQEIDGATEQSFTAEVNGSYGVTISSADCSVSSECVEVIVTSINEMLFPGLVVYPNPATNFILITTETNDQIQVEIVNSNGKTVNKTSISGKQSEISVSDLPPGNYILKFTRDNNVQYVRFVKM